MLHLCSFSPLCVFKCVLKLVASAYLHCHIGCICLTFLLKLSAREEAKSHWLHSFNFSTVCYQTSPKILCRSGCLITRVTFVWLFFTVCFQISPQISCLIGYKITLSAFVWLPHCVLSNESSNVQMLLMTLLNAWRVWNWTKNGSLTIQSLNCLCSHWSSKLCKRCVRNSKIWWRMPLRSDLLQTSQKVNKAPLPMPCRGPFRQNWAPFVRWWGWLQKSSCVRVIIMIFADEIWMNMMKYLLSRAR